MLGAEKAYAKLEQKLQRYLDTYEATHNYDEYHFYLDEIEHDPYVLISILSALHDGVFTLAEVQGELEMLFEKQYILTETVTMQIRYRTKMMVIIGPYGCLLYTSNHGRRQVYFAAAGREAVLLGKVRHHQASALQVPCRRGQKEHL